VSTLSCPRCGEAEELRGSSSGAGDSTGIEVECLTCGHHWDRGDLRCRSCGGATSVELPQRMTRMPRGTLLAVTGLRRVSLCPHCDADVVDEAREHHRPVPEGYVSRFVYDAHAGAAAPLADSTAEPADAGRARPPRRPRRTAARVVALPEAARPASPTSASTADPTLRQATEAFLEQAGPEAETVALVLWGQQVGAATRLSRLDSEEAAHELAAWVVRVWGAQAAARREAVARTLVAAVDHWRERGWLVQDLAAGLR
jgi:hypothetical protein